HLSTPAPAEKQRHQQMEVGVCVARESDWEEIGGGDFDAKLLCELADEWALRRVSSFHLAAGEFPEPRNRAVFRAVGEQNPALAVEQHAGGDENEACDALLHLPVRTGSRH